MKDYIVALAIAVPLAIAPALAQQAAAPRCPDYSLQLAQGMQAYTDRDSAIAQMRSLDAQVTTLKQQLEASEAKVKADDELIAKLRGEKPKEEPAKP